MEGRLGAWTPLSLSKGVVVLAGMPSGLSGHEGIESAGELNCPCGGGSEWVRASNAWCSMHYRKPWSLHEPEW